MDTMLIFIGVLRGQYADMLFERFGEIGHIFETARKRRFGDVLAVCDIFGGAAATIIVDVLDDGFAGQLFELAGQLKFIDVNGLRDAVEGQLFLEIATDIDDSVFNVFKSVCATVFARWRFGYRVVLEYGKQ